MKTLRTPKIRNAVFSVMTLILIPACVSAGATELAKTEKNNERIYWRVYPKSDNTFYLIPRPELSNEFPTPEKINSLPKVNAYALANKLNASLQFEARTVVESGSSMVRISPEPQIQDIVDVCKRKSVHPFLQNRCKKELDWNDKGLRPDIYLPLDPCQAEALADALNDLYGKSRTPARLCPEKDQVAK